MNFVNLLQNVRLNTDIILSNNTPENRSSGQDIRHLVSNILSGVGPDVDNKGLSIDMMSDEDAEEARKFFGVL